MCIKTSLSIFIRVNPFYKLWEHLFACPECTGRYIGMCRACLFASGWVRGHAIGISRMSRPKPVGTFGTRWRLSPLAWWQFLLKIHKNEFKDIHYLHKVKQHLVINKNDNGQVLSAFWPDDLDVYMFQFPPQGGTWHHRLMLKVTSCGRKCAANKPKPGSAHDRRHIMTSPGHTGISRRDIQTSAPAVYKMFPIQCMFLCCYFRAGEQMPIFRITLS